MLQFILMINYTTTYFAIHQLHLLECFFSFLFNFFNLFRMTILALQSSQLSLHFVVLFISVMISLFCFCTIKSLNFVEHLIQWFHESVKYQIQLSTCMYSKYHTPGSINNHLQINCQMSKNRQSIGETTNISCTRKQTSSLYFKSCIFVSTSLFRAQTRTHVYIFLVNIPILITPDFNTSKQCKKTKWLHGLFIQELKYVTQISPKYVECVKIVSDCKILIH